MAVPPIGKRPALQLHIAEVIVPRKLRNLRVPTAPVRAELPGSSASSSSQPLQLRPQQNPPAALARPPAPSCRSAPAATPASAVAGSLDRQKRQTRAGPDTAATASSQIDSACSLVYASAAQ
jgi:hypothetical protein